MARLPQADRGHPKATRWPAIVALVLLAAILAMAGTPMGGPDGARQVVSALARERGPAGVAAAYGYPLRCLSITILATDQAYTRADFNHLRPCGASPDTRRQSLPRHGRVAPGALWADYVCPVASLPFNVQQDSACVCTRASQLHALSEPAPGRLSATACNTVA